MNVVPDRCEFDFEIRELPGDDGAYIVDEFRRFANGTLLPEMKRIAADAAIDLEPLAAYPGLGDDGSAAALKAFCSGLLGDAAEMTLSFGTEGGLFQSIGIPTVVCGPGLISRAHKADEYITTDELRECEAFLKRLA